MMSNFQDVKFNYRTGYNHFGMRMRDSNVSFKLMRVCASQQVFKIFLPIRFRNWFWSVTTTQKLWCSTSLCEKVAMSILIVEKAYFI